MQVHCTRRRALLSLAAVLALPAARASACLAPDRRREFLRAVREGDLEAVEALLSEEPGLAVAVDDERRSAYVLAHLAGQTAVAERLAQEGFELDVVEATLASDWDRVKELIEAEPELAARIHPIGGDPLYARAVTGGDNLYVLRGHGCDPDRAAPGGFTAARAALDHPHGGTVLQVTCDLLGNGASVNAPQAGGDSFLHAVVRRRSLPLLRLALRKGAALDAQDATGRTPLDLARGAGWIAGLALMEDSTLVPRDHRASRFACGADGEPLERLALEDVPFELQASVTGSSHGNLSVVRELVGKDPRLVWSISGDDELAIEASAHVGNAPVMRFHLEHGAPLSLPTAVSLGETAAIDRMLAADPQLLFERGAHDMPLTWFACASGDPVAMMGHLLDHGASLEQESAGTTALHVAALRGSVELVAWLVEHAADVNAVAHTWNGRGETPLAIARRRDHGAVAQLLE